MLTMAEFDSLVYRAFLAHKTKRDAAHGMGRSWRLGQAYFNVCYEFAPDIANDSELEENGSLGKAVFYRDDFIEPFRVFVSGRLG